MEVQFLEGPKENLDTSLRISWARTNHPFDHENVSKEEEDAFGLGALAFP